MSGSSANRVLPNHAPSLPKPVITSSATNSTSLRRQISRTCSRYPAGGGYTPPAPITGSQKNAAMRSAPSCSMSFSSAVASSHGTRSTSETSVPYGSVLAGIPPSDVP